MTTYVHIHDPYHPDDDARVLIDHERTMAAMVSDWAGYNSACIGAKLILTIEDDAQMEMDI